MQKIKIQVNEDDLSSSNNSKKGKILDIKKVKKVEKPEKSKDKSKDKKEKLDKKPKKKGPLKKIFFITLMVIGSILVIGGVYGYSTVYVPYSNIKKETSEIQSIFSSIKKDLESKDATQLDTKIANARSKVKNIENEIKSLSQVRSIPVAAGYLENADKTIKIAYHAFDIIEKTLPSVKNTLTSMGYKTVNNAEGKDLNEDQRLEALIQQIPDLATTYTTIEPDVLSLMDEISNLNPEFIPKVDGVDAKKLITQLNENKSNFKLVSEKIKDTLKVLPKLMGSDGTSRFLIIFNNENELRASGGLISAYGFMEVNKGKINDNIEANDSWYIQQYIWAHGLYIGLNNPDGQAYWMNRGCGGNEMRVQDSGVSPDNVINMETFNKYYDAASKFEKKYAKEGQKLDFPDYDAAIVITTDFAGSILSAVEPLEMPKYNEVLTSQNLAERMSYQTELANSKYATGSKERKSFVKDVSTDLKNKITKSGVDIFPKLIKSVLTSFQQKNIMMYSRADDLQAFFEKWGVTGKLERDYAGDYFNLSEAQNCSLKANLFVKDTVSQEIEIKDDGTIRKIIQVDWENDKIPQKGQENIFNFDFPYRAWVRLFVPKDTKFITSKYGVYYKSEDYYEKTLNKDAIENLIFFQWRRSEKAPPAAYTLSNTYELAQKFDATVGYNQLIQKHPGKAAEAYKIKVKHAGQEYLLEFNLDRDKVIKFKDGVLTIENFDQRLDPLIDMVKEQK